MHTNEVTTDQAEKESCPPIPPNSPRFCIVDGKAQFQNCMGDWVDIERQFAISDKTFFEEHLCQDCRNAARCAWLDEAGKSPLIMDAAVTMNPTTINDWHLKCHANADAWAAWEKGGA